MKPALIFRQYVWLVNLFLRYKSLTLEEVNRKWTDDIGEGKPLSRTTFNRHRDAIRDMFGVDIDCLPRSGYRYAIVNPELLRDNALLRWMLSSLTVGNVLADGLSLTDKILPENVPGGEQFLTTLIVALRNHRIVNVGYQKFGKEPYERMLKPLALKLFRQRWYLLAESPNHIATYALDRFVSAELTEKTFEPDPDFSAADYYRDYYGITTDQTPLEDIVLRVYGKTCNYLRTLPLHHSQRVVNETADYTDFAFRLRPTADFIAAILQLGSATQVLKPKDLRQNLVDRIRKMSARYEEPSPETPAEDGQEG